MHQPCRIDWAAAGQVVAADHAPVTPSMGSACCCGDNPGGVDTPASGEPFRRTRAVRSGRVAAARTSGHIASADQPRHGERMSRLG